ncbi:MAG: ATP-binding protein [Ferruginibacter sp.]
MHRIKKYLLLLITVFFSQQTAAQLLPDSIIKQYHDAKIQTDKNILLTTYVNSIRGNSTFTATVTALNNYLKAEKDEETADYVQLAVNDLLAKTGDYITALASSLEILNRFEKKHDKNGVLSAYRILSTTYYYAGDKGKDIEYGEKAAVIAKEIKNYSRLTSIYNNLSTSYAQSSMPDAALSCALQAIDYAKKTGNPEETYYVLGTLGEAYILRKEYDQALLYLRQSLHAPITTDTLGIVWSYNDLAQIFLETNLTDSAKYYAHKAVDLSQKNRFNDQLQRAYEYLSRAFEKTKVPDSAFRYLQFAVAIRDSLYTSEKSKQVQGITAREQSRLQDIEKSNVELKNKIKIYILLASLLILCVIAFIFFRNNRQKQQANKILEETLVDLKATQTQLIQSEKMASLGELTAGIAHEIQNPLNFVNNFSEVNAELIDELIDEVDKGNTTEVKTIAKDIKDNEERINHHGKRADAIVKGMLQHSRSTSGVKEPTDINALTDEYIRLCYHGLRAKDKSFNATIKTDFDNSIGNINIIPQDIGRVVLNLLTNAFYAVDEKKKSGVDGYEPTVTISTKETGNKVEIKVSDNGNGIPDAIKEKIFQPFFTTKPTGSGTGLGLSLSYDIVKAHGGEIKVDSKVDAGSEFVISLPINKV